MLIAYHDTIILSIIFYCKGRNYCKEISIEGHGYINEEMISLLENYYCLFSVWHVRYGPIDECIRCSSMTTTYQPRQNTT